MKKVLLAVMTFIVINSYAQNSSNSRIGLYIWKQAVMIQPADVNGTALNNGATPPVNDQPIASKSGQKFRVLQLVSNNTLAVIQVLDYTEKNTKTRKYKATSDFYKYNFKGTAGLYTGLTDEAVNSRSYGTNQAYFTVPIGIITDETLAIKEDKIGGALAAGVINFPFKYRPQKGMADFSGAFNFGAGIGYKFPHKSWRQFSYSIMSGYSISNVVLDSSNSNKNQGKLASTNNFTAFSFSIGFLAEYQRVQAGIFLGWDRISKINQREFEWQYQGKSWISVGFGFAIFSAQKEEAATEQQQ